MDARLNSIALLLLLAVTQAHGQEWRQIRPIATPAARPAGARPIEARPVPAAAIRQAAERITADWNRADAGSHLAPGFHDASRHQDAMAYKVPKDARLTLEAVRAVQTMEQYETLDAAHGRVRVSTVAATLATRLEFDDPTRGHVALPGVNNVLLEVLEPLK